MPNLGRVTRKSIEMPITDDELKERHAFWKEHDQIVNRAKVASALGLSPNRVSELVGLGVLQYVSRKPLLFALEHCKGCYRDYQWWLTVRKPGEHYVRPEQREAADFGEWAFFKGFLQKAETVSA